MLISLQKVVHNMPRPKKDKTVTYTKLERDLLEAANAMLAHERGELGKGNAEAIIYNVPENVDVRVIRNELHLTQEQFAHLIGSSVHAVRHWENGRRIPDSTARILLQVLHYNPTAVLEALGQHNQ